MEVPLPGGGNLPVDPGPPGLPPPPPVVIGGGLGPVPGGAPAGPVDGELLFLPDPEAGVLNHGGAAGGPAVVGAPPPPNPLLGGVGAGINPNQERKNKIALKVNYLFGNVRVLILSFQDRIIWVSHK